MHVMKFNMDVRDFFFNFSFGLLSYYGVFCTAGIRNINIKSYTHTHTYSLRYMRIRQKV